MEKVIPREKNGAKVKSIVWKGITYVILAFLAVVLVFPFFVMIMRSFMDITDIYAARIFPSHITFENYRAIFAENNYFKYAFNTLKVVCFNVIAVPLSASLCAKSDFSSSL